MLIRLRRNMLVGLAKLSCSEIVGNVTGSAPANRTPRFTASTSCGTFPWHGLNSDAVSTIPMMRRSSASSVYPAPLMNALRRKRLNSSSPYDVRRERRPVVCGADMAVCGHVTDSVCKGGPLTRAR